MHFVGLVCMPPQERQRCRQIRSRPTVQKVQLAYQVGVGHSFKWFGALGYVTFVKLLSLDARILDAWRGEPVYNVLK